MVKVYRAFLFSRQQFHIMFLLRTSRFLKDVLGLRPVSDNANKNRKPLRHYCQKRHVQTSYTYAIAIVTTTVLTLYLPRLLCCGHHELFTFIIMLSVTLCSLLVESCALYRVPT